MRTRVLNLLLVAALLFAVARLWRLLEEPPPVLPTIAGAPAPEPPAQPEQAPAGVEARPEAYDVIVARDLFSPTRGVVPPAPAAVARPAPKPQAPPKLTLYGVVILDGVKTAFLQEGTAESRPRKVREKEAFAGGVVSAIRPDGVTFLFGGSEIVVPLRTPKDGAGPAAPGARVPGATVREAAPMALPRRPTPVNLPPGQIPAPGRPPVPSRRNPAAVMPGEPGSEADGHEEFPEGMGPEDVGGEVMDFGGEVPEAPDDEMEE